MSHHDGHEHAETEHAGHGHNGHEHAHEHEHGHDPLKHATDVIPESSLQDKVLMLVGGLCLAGLLYFGSLWAFALTVPTHAEHIQSHGQGAASGAKSSPSHSEVPPGHPEEAPATGEQ